jgi:hypothetical protein
MVQRISKAIYEQRRATKGKTGQAVQQRRVGGARIASGDPRYLAGVRDAIRSKAWERDAEFEEWDTEDHHAFIKERQILIRETAKRTAQATVVWAKTILHKNGF